MRVLDLKRKRNEEGKDVLEIIIHAVLRSNCFSVLGVKLLNS